MKNLLSGKKTYLVSVACVLYGVVIYGLDDKDWQGCLKFILAGAGGASVRAAIAKVEALLLELLPKPVENVVKPIVDAEVAKVEG